MTVSRAIRSLTIACIGLASMAMAKPPSKPICRDSTNLTVWRLAHDHKSRRTIVQYLWDRNIEFIAGSDDSSSFKLVKGDYTKLADVEEIVRGADLHEADYWSQGFLITARELVVIKFDARGNAIGSECKMAYTGP